MAYLCRNVSHVTGRRGVVYFYDVMSVRRPYPIPHQQLGFFVSWRLSARMFFSLHAFIFPGIYCTSASTVLGISVHVLCAKHNTEY